MTRKDFKIESLITLLKAEGVNELGVTPEDLEWFLRMTPEERELARTNLANSMEVEYVTSK